MCGNYTPSSKTSFFRVEQIVGCQTNKTVSPLPWLLCVSSFTTVLHRVCRVREALSTLPHLPSLMDAQGSVRYALRRNGVEVVPPSPMAGLRPSQKIGLPRALKLLEAVFLFYASPTQGLPGPGTCIPSSVVGLQKTRKALCCQTGEAAPTEA